ncbi:hypothetical protein [Hippea alviniae]|uniref:hypothetical protein n=1 Tax=Hippea alviniae TaxID=1279027 RepID=UPI0003B772B7|nr:hypothetical protein [Hippea alviniae]
MKKSVYVATIVGLSAIILVLLSYITFTNSSSLLKIAINAYLKKYNITSSFEKLNIKSASSINIKGFSIKTDKIKADADELLANLDKKGNLNLKLTNPIIEINLSSQNESKGSNFTLPALKIGRIEIDNLTLNLIAKEKTIKISKMNINLTSKNIEFTGTIIFKDKNSSLTAEIEKAKGELNFSSNSILIPKMLIKPKSITFTKDKAQLLIKQPIYITNLLINLSPFSVSFGSIDTSDLQAKYKKHLVNISKAGVFLKQSIIKASLYQINLDNKLKFNIPTSIFDLKKNFLISLLTT